MEFDNNIERDQSIDLSELKRQMDAHQAAQSATNKDEETKVIGSDWMNTANKNEQTPITEPVNNQPTVSESTPVASNDNYNGPGLVINKEEFTAEPEALKENYTGITPETQNNVDEYLAKMDEEIHTAKEEKERIEEDLKEKNDLYENDSEDSSMTSDEFNDKYNEAVVIIDKSNFGNIIDFTDDEHAKLEKSKKIRLEEVETISLETIKTKKIKKKSDLDKIIKKVSNINTTNIVLPISGYTATIRGCSAYELISLIDDNNNALLNAQNKWSLIHSKLESTSLGNMDFNEFLLNTAAGDYNNFIYGLLCSTYPDDDKLPVTCPKCKKNFDHNYSVRSLIRAEEMSDKLKDTIMEVVDNSVSEEAAKTIHENAPISLMKRVKLPMSGIIAEIYVQSAYDLINKSIKSLSENTDEKYNNTAVISTLVKTLYIPDTEDEGSYYEVSNGIDIAKTLYTLNERDVMIIRKIGEGFIEDLTIDYGIMNIKCPSCGHYIPTMKFDLEDILFYRYRQALSTEIE